QYPYPAAALPQASPPIVGSRSLIEYYYGNSSGLARSSAVPSNRAEQSSDASIGDTGIAQSLVQTVDVPNAPEMAARVGSAAKTSAADLISQIFPPASRPPAETKSRRLPLQSLSAKESIEAKRELPKENRAATSLSNRRQSQTKYDSLLSQMGVPKP